MQNNQQYLTIGLLRAECTRLEGCGITMDILRVIHRARSNNVLAINRREIHVLHQMFTKTLSNMQLSSIRRKELPPADMISLELVNAEGKNLGIMTLTQAWDHIKHSGTPSHLAQMDSGSYRIQPLKVETDERSLNKQRSTMKRTKRAGRSKEFPFTTTEQGGRLQLILSKAYTFLLQGIRVEFCLSQKVKGMNKVNTVDWALENAPHLRPDTILSAMPEGSKMLVQPCTAAASKNVIKHSSVIWSVEHPPSLQKYGGPTPKALYKVGQWRGEYKPLAATPSRTIGERGTDLDVSDIDFPLERLLERPTIQKT